MGGYQEREGRGTGAGPRGDLESKGGRSGGGLAAVAILHVPRSPSCRMCLRKGAREREWAERKSGGGVKERGKAAGSAGLQVKKAVYKWSLVGDVVVLWAKSVSWGWGAKGGKKKRQASRPR